MDRFSFSSRKMPEHLHYQMVLCPVCDLCYASPAMDPSVIRKKYQDAVFVSPEESRHAAETYAAFLRKFVVKLPVLDGALDVGASDGAFIEKLLELGFGDVAGVEPSKPSVASARSSIRPLIRNTAFNADDFSRQSMSLVSCLQTLEHIENPRDLFFAAHDLLRPGGALFTVAHNFRSVSARILRSRSPIFDIEHLQLFSQKSLRELYHRAGFTDVRVFWIFNRYRVHYWLKMLPLNPGVKEKIVTLFRKIGLTGIGLTLPAGNMAAIGFKPVFGRKQS